MLNELVEVLPHAEREASALLPSSHQVSATSEQPRTVQTAGADGLRFARDCMLEELVGLAFGAMTILYIVASLIALN